jgi:transposase
MAWSRDPVPMIASTRFMLWDGRFPLLGHDDWPAEEESMSFNLVAFDLGKRSFHLHAMNDEGIVLSIEVSVAKLLGAVAESVPATGALEACPSAHEWGRCSRDVGYQEQLIHPRFVKPFVRGSRNDAVDAGMISEAAAGPTMS